jgi:hypothetical protein
MKTGTHTQVPVPMTTYAGQIAVVAVLQFQNRFYDSQKLTLYLYINIEVFLGYGKSLSRTATLQRAQILSWS